jgi:hypothetical protein
MRLITLICVAIKTAITPIVVKDFEVRSVKLTVQINRTRHIDSNYWVFGEIVAVFPPGAQYLKLQCMQFSAGGIHTSAGYIASFASQEPALHPDKSGKVAKDVYWVADRPITVDELKQFNLTYLAIENC